MWLKSTVADKVLLPVREQLISLITPGSTLLDVGCGTGDLLFKSASNLTKGCGVDIDEAMINYAQEKRRREEVNNIEFICGDILNIKRRAYDISTSTLCLYEVGNDLACKILELMISHSRKVLIADYTSARTLSGKIGIELDEMFSGHYGNFKKYRKCGEIPYFARQVGANIKDAINTKIDGISIWVIEGK